MIREFIELVKYACKEKKVIFITFVVALVAIILAFQNFDRANLKLFWDHFGDWPTAVLTLLIAVSVFFWELRQDWRESREKKLTVIFTYEDKEVMRCNNATLSSEADLRALSQQIGRQMAKENLKLKPMLDNVKKELSDDKKEMHYEVSICLWQLEGETSSRSEDPQGRLKGVFDRGSKLVWEPPFLEEPKEVKQNASRAD